MKDAAGADGVGGAAKATKRSTRHPAKAFGMLECVPRAFGTDID